MQGARAAIVLSTLALLGCMGRTALAAMADAPISPGGTVFAGERWF